MKTLPLCICSVVLAVTAMAQPAPPPPPPPSPAASMTASAPPAQDLADRIHQRIEKKLKGHHGIAIDGDEADLKRIKSDDIPEFVIPIVAITMLTIFGLMVWLGAVNDWEGGAWSLGLIPFLIGAGYLIVWKLEGKKDISSPPPAP